MRTAEPEAARRPRVVVLDDDAEIRSLLRRFLTAQGFDVRAVADSAQLDVQLERQWYDVLVLDVMMAGEDGLSVCRRLRSQGHTIPILMLTARGDPVDRVVGLDVGADDYLAKPFLPSELAARIKAMLRRQAYLSRTLGMQSLSPVMPEAETLAFGRFKLDLRHQELCEGDSLVPLGSAEVRLLCALAATPNRPVSRDNLIERARGRDYEANSRSVDVQILRLRQTIEEDASHPRHIRTVWRVGYMLVAEVLS